MDYLALIMTATKMDLPAHLKSRLSGPTEYQAKAYEGAYFLSENSAKSECSQFTQKAEQIKFYY